MGRDDNRFRRHSSENDGCIGEGDGCIGEGDEILHKPSLRVSGFFQGQSNPGSRDATWKCKPIKACLLQTSFPLQLLKMSTYELHWTRLILSTTELYATVANEENEATIQWHSEGSTLYIVMNNDRPEIDLRMESEMFDVKVGLLWIQTGIF